VIVRRSIKRIGVMLLIGIVALILADLMFPPPLEKALDRSVVVTDRNGEWLHAFSNNEKRWRFKTDLDDIDPDFIANLIAVEDERFYYHPGVDPFAIIRALLKSGRAGRIVSGASTITMQTARLLEPKKRTFLSKVSEAVRALQIERRLSKDEILALYLTLTPYGGNLEGIRSASLFYFGKEPATLTLSEQALLIALPQAPEARRPDRHKEPALFARAKILDRLTDIHQIDYQITQEAKLAFLPTRRRIFDRYAYHASMQAVKDEATSRSGTAITTIDLKTQIEAERIVKNHVATQFDDGATAAVIIIDNISGEIRALVGSSGIDIQGGWIDLTNASRSPGSLLKPFIYGIAFDDGILGPNTLVNDMPRGFGDYRPENFDRTFRGEIRVREALQHSLNIPAVDALERVGASRFIGKLISTGSVISQRHSSERNTGLAVALGGAGITLRDVSALYLGLANEGVVIRPKLLLSSSNKEKKRLISAASAKRINTILKGAPSLPGRGPAHLSKSAPLVAYKTGTSYGYRDAWAAGHAGDLTIAVWTGRADGAPRPGYTGRKAAAPLLFALFDRFGTRGSQLLDTDKNKSMPGPLVNNDRNSRPTISFPKDGVSLLLMPATSNGIRLAADGGEGKLTWYVDGKKVPLSEGAPIWFPPSEGFYTLKVFDRTGASTQSQIRIIAS